MKKKIQHQGLNLLAYMDIKELIDERGEQDAIEVVAKLISRNARTVNGAEYVDVEQNLGGFVDIAHSYHKENKNQLYYALVTRNGWLEFHVSIVKDEVIQLNALSRKIPVKHNTVTRIAKFETEALAEMKAYGAIEARPTTVE